MALSTSGWGPAALHVVFILLAKERLLELEMKKISFFLIDLRSLWNILEVGGIRRG